MPRLIAAVLTGVLFVGLSTNPASADVEWPADAGYMNNLGGRPIQFGRGTCGDDGEGEITGSGAHVYVMEVMVHSLIYGTGVMELCGVLDGVNGQPPECSAYSGHSGRGVIHFGGEDVRRYVDDFQWSAASALANYTVATGRIKSADEHAAGLPGQLLWVEAQMTMQGGNSGLGNIACWDEDPDRWSSTFAAYYGSHLD